MLPHAVLVLRNTTGEAVVIPVTNFPVLPVGSDIDLYLTDKVVFEDATIIEYSLDSRYGVKVDVDFAIDDSPRSGEIQDRDWDELAKLCVEDPNNYYPWIYPHTIDFGIKFPMSSK